MAVTTRGGEQTIIPPMSSVVEGDMRKQDNVEEPSEELDDATTKEVKIPQKVVSIP